MRRERSAALADPDALAGRQYLSFATAGRSVDRTRGFVYGLVKQGAVRPVRVAGALRIPAGEWERWIAENVEEVTT